jgi:hypothetical protein
VCPKKEISPHACPDLTEGQYKLGLALIGLPRPAGCDNERLLNVLRRYNERHPADRDDERVLNHLHLDVLLDAFRTTPDIVLRSVSQELEEQRQSGQLRMQPRLEDLANTVKLPTTRTSRSAW